MKSYSLNGALDNWFAIDARSPSEPEKCNLGWDSELQLFFDECDADTTYPPSGEGLVRYAVMINEDESLRVDLNKLVDDYLQCLPSDLNQT